MFINLSRIHSTSAFVRSSGNYVFLLSFREMALGVLSLDHNGIVYLVDHWGKYLNKVFQSPTPKWQFNFVLKKLSGLRRYRRQSCGVPTACPADWRQWCRMLVAVGLPAGLCWIVKFRRCGERPSDFHMHQGGAQVSRVGWASFFWLKKYRFGFLPILHFCIVSNSMYLEGYHIMIHHGLQ